MMTTKVGTQAWSSKPQPGIRHSTESIATVRSTKQKSALRAKTLARYLIRSQIQIILIHRRKRERLECGVGQRRLYESSSHADEEPRSDEPVEVARDGAQLAQFTSLEKLTNIETGIDRLRTENKPDKNFEALAMIGKSVVTDSTKINRAEAKGSHDLKFRLMADATKATVTIKRF